MNNSIAWHDTFLKKYRVTKVVLQHVSDYDDEKSFRWGFNNNNGCCVIICVIYGLNWPIHSVRGALGFFDIFLRSVFVPKNFGFSDWVFIMDFPSFSIWFSVFVINTCLMGFGFGFQCGFVYAPLVNTVSDRSGFWKLRCEHLKILTVLHEVFGFDRIFLRFCGCG